MPLTERTERVRKRAYELGFDGCGFAKAGRLEPQERKLEEWLNQGRHGDMKWMENHFDKRVDPTKLVPGAESVVSVMASYHHPDHKRQIGQDGIPKIAKYAQGRDYHKTFKKRLAKLFAFCKESIGDVQGRIFVDSAPVLDKAWAVQSGIGWMGRNSNILNKSHGSFFVIGEIIIDAKFQYDRVTTDHCGTCTRCIDACPTDAIYEPYKVDATRCISYLTIEMKDKMPSEYRDKVGEWMFGCDICQDVCPWNRKARYGTIEDLKPRRGIPNKSKEFWEELNIEEYQELFNGSTVRRAKFDKLKNNIHAAAGNIDRNLEHHFEPGDFLKNPKTA